MTTAQPDYEAVLADLKAKRDQIDAAIAAIEAISGIAVGSARPGGAVAIEGDTFFGMTALEAAIKYLGMVKKVQSPTEIAEALEAGGMTHSSQNLANTLYTTLSRSASHNGPVVKVGKNWGLAEWYPGLKNKRTRTGADSSGQSDDTDAGAQPEEDDVPDVEGGVDEAEVATVRLSSPK